MPPPGQQDGHASKASSDRGGVADITKVSCTCTHARPYSKARSGAPQPPLIRARTADPGTDRTVHVQAGATTAGSSARVGTGNSVRSADSRQRLKDKLVARLADRMAGATKAKKHKKKKKKNRKKQRGGGGDQGSEEGAKEEEKGVESQAL